MIDTHCHLDVEAFDRDRAEVLSRAWAAGVTGILVPAIRPRTWSRVVALGTRRGRVLARHAVAGGGRGRAIAGVMTNDAHDAAGDATRSGMGDGTRNVAGSAPKHETRRDGDDDDVPNHQAGRDVHDAPNDDTRNDVRDAADDATSELAHDAADDAGRSESVVWIALGIHPQIVPELDADERTGDLAARIAAAAVDAGAVAIGECGLDGATADHAVQETILRAHIRAARDTRLPLVLHVVRAHDLAPRILRDERAHEVGGILHSYSGSAELVSVYRDLGMAFSFAGPITYENARRPSAAARAVPDELLLAETDSPDQSPADHRGERNEPSFLPSVMAGLATARGTSPETIATLTTANARRLLGTVST